MSIASEISRLQTAKQNIKSSIEGKGVNVPSDATLSDYPDYIDNIEQGGGDYDGIIKSLSEDEITASGSFDPKNYITEVTIPSGFTSITGFINLTGLTSVEIPNSIITLENSCFQNCQNLKEINIPNSVVNIRVNSFRECKNLTNVKLGSGVATIGKYAFMGCIHLESIDIPNSIVSIGESAFQNCRILTSVTINATTPPTLETNVFNNTHSTMKIYVPCEAVDAYKTATNWSTYASQIQEIPNSCPPKVKLTLTDGTTVEKECDGNTGLTSSEIAGLAAKTDITEAKIGNCVKKLEQNVFNGCTSLTGVSILKSVTSIGSSAFEKCSSLTSITIPDSVTSIDSSAFNSCSSLTSATIPDSVTSIGQLAFRNCSSLTSITIPDSVTSIGQMAFQSCSSLTSATIGTGVTSIGSLTFSVCNSLTSITVNATTPPTLGSSVFSSKNHPIYVPSESLEAYKVADGWSQYASRIFAIE